MEDGDLPEDDEYDKGEGIRRFQAKKCNQRLDELSTPQRRMYLELWNQHAYHLPEDKVKRLKHLLQQLYALTPEETVKYFAEMRAKAKAAERRRKLKQKLRKYLQDKNNKKQRERAYKLFNKILKCGIQYAVRTPVPPLVSIRLRYLSDIILEQLCDLKKVDVPKRCKPGPYGSFLISIADWVAIAVERLYYAAQLSINEMSAGEGSHEAVPGAASPESQPKAAAAPKDSFEKRMAEELGDEYRPPPPDPYYSIIDAEPIVTKKPPIKVPCYNPRQQNEEMLTIGAGTEKKTKKKKKKSKNLSRYTTRKMDSTY